MKNVWELFLAVALVYGVWVRIKSSISLLLHFFLSYINGKNPIDFQKAEILYASTKTPWEQI